MIGPYGCLSVHPLSRLVSLLGAVPISRVWWGGHSSGDVPSQSTVGERHGEREREAAGVVGAHPALDFSPRGDQLGTDSACLQEIHEEGRAV